MCTSIEIYFDFSGYSDMAVGVARMLNIDLPINFDSPYKALSIRDFWKRWHMSLTGFFTRNVYIPLGGSRRGRLRLYLNVMLVFLLSGIWHGANWTFILWGLLHGALSVFERVFEKYEKRINSVIRWAYAFLSVNFLWLLFRAESVSQWLGSVGQPQHLSEELKAVVAENVRQNIVATAQAHPEATFYYFLPPYSLAYWHDKVASGEIYAQFEAEQIAIELMLQCANIKVFDFSARTDIISDVNNYRDLLHYGDWINSFMLKWMREGECLLTEDNYRAHLESQFEYYTTYDYSRLLAQGRYNCDYYAAALLNEELCGTAPRSISEQELLAGELRSAELEADPDSGGLVLKCSGTLGRDPAQELGAFLLHQDYAGLKLSLPDAGDYSYLCFKGRNTGFNGQPTVYAYDGNGNVISSVEMKYHELEGGWQQFALDLRDAGGAVIIFNGAYTDYTGHPASSFEFKDLKLY